jgi:hypothetical protein
MHDDAPPIVDVYVPVAQAIIVPSPEQANPGVHERVHEEAPAILHNPAPHGLASPFPVHAYPAGHSV